MSLSPLGLPSRGPGAYAKAATSASTKTGSVAFGRLGNSGLPIRARVTSPVAKVAASARDFVVSGHKLSPMGLPARATGAVFKVPGDDTVVEYTNRPDIRIDSDYTYRIERDILIEYIGVEIVLEEMDGYEIVVGGVVLDYTNRPDIVIQSFPYSIEAEEADTTYVYYQNQPNITIQTQSGYEIARDILVEYTNRPNITIQANTGYTLELPVLGEQTLSNLDYINIANQVVKRTNTVSGLSLEKQLNVILAATAGSAFNFKPSGQMYTDGEEFGYYGTDGVTKVIRGTYVGGNRVIIDLNPED